MFFLFSGFLIAFFLAVLLAFLFPEKKAKATPPPPSKPSRAPIYSFHKEVIYDGMPGRAYPLKVYVYFHNDSSDCLDVRVSRWVSGIDAQIFHQVLQLSMAKSWHPTPNGEASLHVPPGGKFRLWIAPGQKYGKNTLQFFCDHDRLGTLVLLINNQERSFVV